MDKILCIFVALTVCSAAHGQAHVTVGIPTVLTGDLAVAGDNIRKTVETYTKRHLRHPIKFLFEDSKKSGLDGLTAYKKLIEVDRVDMLIGGTVSNGTMAGSSLINQSKTVMLTPLTGGTNIDNAGEYIFRIGNSDVLNAKQQADLLLSRGLRRVAVLTEQTEYTKDIAEQFRKFFQSGGGELVFDEDFLPDENSFGSTIVRMTARKPQALFMSTQTGVAFGIFMKRLRQVDPSGSMEIHTNFVAACNPDAFKIGGGALDGVRYLNPSYDKGNTRLVKFFSEFVADHGSIPAIPIHTAGVVDILDILQSYLDTVPTYDREQFHDFLLTAVKNYQGLMGMYSFDRKGNADVGFVPYVLAVKDRSVRELPVPSR